MSLRSAALSVGCWMVLLGICPFAAFTQEGADETTLEGKVSGVTTKGKTTTLKVTDEGGTEHEFTLAPKVELEIVATGDDGFLADGQMVKIAAIQSNEAFFGSQFDVYPQYVGRAAPAKGVKAPLKIGQSQSLHYITGEVSQLADIPDGKYDLLDLKGTGKMKLQVYVEPNHRVRVIFTDPKMIKVDQKVTVTGKAAGAKFNASKVTVNTGDTLKGAEFLPTLGKKKK